MQMRDLHIAPGEKKSFASMLYESMGTFLNQAQTLPCCQRQPEFVKLGSLQSNTQL